MPHGFGLRRLRIQAAAVLILLSFPGSSLAREIDPVPSPPPGSYLETRLVGVVLVLDWSSTEKNPARFRILKPDGRAIAMRRGKRSVQGWIASLRIAGWPGGIYLAEVESGSIRTVTKILLP